MPVTDEELDLTERERDNWAWTALTILVLHLTSMSVLRHAPSLVYLSAHLGLLAWIIWNAVHLWIERLQFDRS